MKKTPLAPQFLALLGLAISVSSFGQTDKLIAINTNNRITTEPAAGYNAAPAPKIVSATVEEGFVKWYPQATNAKWSTIEKGFQASFTNAGQKTTAVFDTQGKFSYSVAEVSAENMPQELIAFIKKEYPGYKLLQSVAIRDNVKTIYQTSLQNGNDFIKIKSIGEEMEVSSLKNQSVQ
ncbi:hypothetical protein LZZ85_00065 [Terrimonas sp. NA20]|uniref:Beta-lactamase-inhibitor-like PepSY-like domain-containing protein n=1 Tax=Terrimonas ginsenosidimutans TaxID=2908004 RepID=A0ABS9KJZ0_9BACT|nr:hypothetical protein [Terrimonas ginsenosidimutans]MCG2612643.1 hypothetical protein [Terrimonas ginsenosidimutans]